MTSKEEMVEGALKCAARGLAVFRLYHVDEEKLCGCAGRRGGGPPAGEV